MGSGIFRNCHHCTKRFEVTRGWQLFCCDICRKRWNYIESGYCFYCGEPGSMHRDHIHPVAARTTERRSFAGQETVYSCVECNSSLGAKIFGDIVFRVKWLIEHYNKKYKLDIGAVGWSETELAELGPSLRKRVKHLLTVRHKAERRVLYLRAVLGELNRRPPKLIVNSGRMEDL